MLPTFGGIKEIVSRPGQKALVTEGLLWRRRIDLPLAFQRLIPVPQMRKQTDQNRLCFNMSCRVVFPSQQYRALTFSSLSIH